MNMKKYNKDMLKERIIPKQQQPELDLAMNIERIYGKYGVKIDAIAESVHGKRICYRIELKGKTTIPSVLKHAKEVQSRLELPLFQVYLNGFTIYLVVSDHKPKYARLPKVLNSHIHKRMEKMKLPYLIGYDALAEPIIVDLAEFPHLLEGGSSGSGKTVGLQILIASIASTKEPSEVNFILIDVGVGDLIPFDKIPHLSCPVIQNHETAHNALIALEAEMKKRIQLKNENPTAFTQMPRLVLVIDEFTDLVTGGGDKDMSMQMADSISSLLRKGRHAKIHLVLATQNPVYRNMKVAMENITARIAFRCAKKNNSETILGAEGAEYLDGEGSLLLKSPQNMGLQRIQGIYINATEIRQLVQELKSRQWRYSMEHKFTLTTPENFPSESKDESYSHLPPVIVAACPTEQDRLFARVLIWAFGQERISTNKLMIEHHLGWSRACNLILELEKLGIVDKPNGKQPRCVWPKSIEDVPSEMVAFMERCGYPPEALICAFEERAR